MTTDYVGAAYAVFALVLGWDYLAPRIKLARVRRAIALRIHRDAARKKA
jgi:heme exporter protein D